MISPQLRHLIRPLVLIQQVVWVVITGSIVFYFAIVYVLAGNAAAGALSNIPGLETAIYVVAALVSVCSILYRRYSLSRESLTRNLKKEPNLEELAMDPRTKRVDVDKLGRLESLNDFEKRVFSLMYYLQKVTFINLFLNEMVVILGFVLAFLSGDAWKITPFGIVSLVLSVWMFPRAGAVIERARYLYSA